MNSTFATLKLIAVQSSRLNILNIYSTECTPYCTCCFLLSTPGTSNVDKHRSVRRGKKPIFGLHASSHAVFFLRSHKRIPHPHTPIQSPVLKIFGDNLLQTIMLRVGPEVRIEPGNTICRRAYAPRLN